jgi:ankyrin repeat protein
MVRAGRSIASPSLTTVLTCLRIRPIELLRIFLKPCFLFHSQLLGHPRQEEHALLSAAPGIDLEYGNSEGLSPLFTAWKHGHVGVVKTLLDHGAPSKGVRDVW